MRRFTFLAALFLAVASLAWAQYTYKLSAPLSRENFRIAVEAYQRGRFAEALMLLEKTLADSPTDSLTLYWLGKTYRQLGLDPAALSLWDNALSTANPSPFVAARAELASALMDQAGPRYSGALHSRTGIARYAKEGRPLLEAFLGAEPTQRRASHGGPRLKPDSPDKREW